MVDATLVTIHGFWSSPATWDRLDAIWNADEQLRGLRIHPFPYPSPKRPLLPLSMKRVPDYDDLAQTLATEYRVGLAEASNVAIVTHSQGGLILQRFLAWSRTDKSSPSRNVVLSQPSSSTSVTARCDHCGNCSAMSRDATSAVISPFSTPTSCIDHAITRSPKVPSVAVSPIGCVAPFRLAD
jgi:Alpha/beta hydrolase family